MVQSEFQIFFKTFGVKLPIWSVYFFFRFSFESSWFQNSRDRFMVIRKARLTLTPREKCPNTELFLVCIFSIRTEYRKIRTRNNSVSGQFLRSVGARWTRSRLSSSDKITSNNASLKVSWTWSNFSEWYLHRRYFILRTFFINLWWHYHSHNA